MTNDLTLLAMRAHAIAQRRTRSIGEPRNRRLDLDAALLAVLLAAQLTVAGGGLFDALDPAEAPVTASVAAATQSQAP